MSRKLPVAAAGAGYFSQFHHNAWKRMADAGEDAGIVLFEFENGRRGIFDGNRLVDHAADNRRLTMGVLTVEGSSGVLSLDGNAGLCLRPFGSNDERAVEFEWNDIDFGGDCVYLTNRHVVEHLGSGAPVMNTAEDSFVNLRIEAAIYRSAESGRTVRLGPASRGH